MTIRWLNPLSQHENVLQFSILVAKFIPTRTTTAAAILVISRVPLVWTEWRIIPYSPKALLIIKSRYGQMVFLKRYIIYVRHQAISTYRERRERSHTLLATDTWQLPAKAIRNEDIKKLPANRGWCWTFCVFLSRIFFLENWKFTLHLYSWLEYDKWQNFAFIFAVARFLTIFHPRIHRRINQVQGNVSLFLYEAGSRHCISCGCLFLTVFLTDSLTSWLSTRKQTNHDSYVKSYKPLITCFFLSFRSSPFLKNMKVLKPSWNPWSFCSFWSPTLASVCGR